jgi:hypothetical protein
MRYARLQKKIKGRLLKIECDAQNHPLNRAPSGVPPQANKGFSGQAFP